MPVRIIVKLDVKPPYVVKPIHFEGLKVVGLPSELAIKYYADGADELVYIDIVSSLYRRDIIFDDIKKTADKIFIPFSVGGGVKTIDDYSKLFHSGADKVVINTYAVQEDSSIINKASEIFGKQSVVVNIEAKKHSDGWMCYTDGGKIQGHKDVLEWAKEVEVMGAGEILLQSVDCDGKQTGFDIELAKKIVMSVNIPVVVASGAGSVKDIERLIKEVKPSGVALASLLHHNRLTIKEIKCYLKKSGIKVSG